ncbi:hypothetical protein GF362_02310 [Candidatus Dojkabacteria bacterium]|nr:hypothetical protein [Candidatus Dojkabacteria bacterium]
MEQLPVFDFYNDQAIDTPDFPSSLIEADIDGDGDLDILALNAQRVDSVDGDYFNHYILLNEEGKFQFENPLMFQSGERLGDAAFGDLDNDGDLDIYTTSYWRGEDSVYLNTGNQFNILNQNETYEHEDGLVELVDIDDDGDLDAIVTTQSHNYQDPPQNPTQVRLNDGSGQFANSVTLGRSSRTVDTAIADVDGDGDQDYFQRSYERGLEFFENQGDGSFAEGEAINIGTTIYSFDLGDIDGDGKDDLVVLHQDKPEEVLEMGALSWLERNGDSWQIEGDHFWNGLIPYNQDIELGDVDGDGDFDVLIGGGAEKSYFPEVHYDVQPARVVHNAGLSPFENVVEKELKRNNIETPIIDPYDLSLVLADIDGDGKDEPIISSFFNEGQDITIWDNDPLLFLPVVVRNFS